MVVTLAPLLCLPKAFIQPVQNLLQSHERQSFVIATTVIAGITDLGVAWWLIPMHGAVGACIGSGAAQVTAIGSMWAVCIYLYKVRLPWLLLAKITFISIVASLTAHFIAIRFAPLWAILLGGSASIIVLLGLMLMMRVLEAEDRARFTTLARMLPKPIAGPLENTLSFLCRRSPIEMPPLNVL
jgi:O-antigen/teichoic acid export membrane protein